MSSQPKSRRKAVFIVTSFWAHGELQIALYFARKFQQAIEPIFVIPKLHSDKLRCTEIKFFNLMANAGNINKLLFYDIEKRFAPELVILADFLNFSFCHRHYGLEDADLDVFSGLLCGFDIYDYERSIKAVDSYGRVASHMSGLSLANLDYAIQPVPVCLPVKSSSSRIFRYGLLPEIHPVNKHRHNVAGKKNLLIVCSKWQFASGHPQCADNLSKYIFSSLRDFIRVSADEYKFTCLGHDIAGSEDLGKNYKYVESMSSVQFNALVENTHCAIGMNYISTSLAGVALKGIPVINLKNSFLRVGEHVINLNTKRKCDPDDFIKDYFYPFLLFPVGWYKFLSHLRGNRYFELFMELEIFELDGLREVVRRAVENIEPYIERTNNYIDRVRALDSCCDIEAIV